MGEIAEMIADGIQCSHCGCIFQKDDKVFEHGYPCLCWDCWDDETPDERAGLPRAITDTF